MAVTRQIFASTVSAADDVCDHDGFSFVDDDPFILPHHHP